MHDEPEFEKPEACDLKDSFKNEGVSEITGAAKKLDPAILDALAYGYIFASRRQLIPPSEAEQRLDNLEEDFDEDEHTLQWRQKGLSWEEEAKIKEYLEGLIAEKFQERGHGHDIMLHLTPKSILNNEVAWIHVGEAVCNVLELRYPPLKGRFGRAYVNGYFTLKLIKFQKSLLRKIVPTLYVS